MLRLSTQTPEGVLTTRRTADITANKDLAEQTHKCIMKFSKYLVDPPLQSVLLVGGGDEKEQTRALQDGLDIVVGTLQKTMDFVRRETLDVTQVKFLVLDEADDLQKKDDRGDLLKLNTQIKRARRDPVQTLFFSATLHTPEVKKLISEITIKATWVDLKGKDAVPDTVHSVAYLVDPSCDLPWADEDVASRAKYPSEQPIQDGVHAKPSMSEFDKQHPKALRASERIKIMKPKMVVKIADAFNMPQCLVFCRTNIDCNNLEAYLNRLDGTKGHRGKFESGKENPYSCVVLAGARQQKERQRNLDSFKEGDVRFLICTDVAARGIDIAGLPFVIQMTLPDDIENFIHRIGRCGRAERMGLAIALVSTEREKVWYHKCQSRGARCAPPPGNTKLTIPFGADGNVLQPNEEKWWIEEGGCTVWHDESDLLKQVEVRIGGPVMLMDREDFSVDDVLDSPLPVELRKKKPGQDGVEAEDLGRRALKRKTVDTKAIVYGTKKNDTSSAANTKQSLAIAPTVTELGALEKEIQRMFGRALWGCGSSLIGTCPPAAAVPGILTAAVAPTAQVAVGEKDAILCSEEDVPSKKAAGAPTVGEKPKKKVRW